MSPIWMFFGPDLNRFISNVIRIQPMANLWHFWWLQIVYLTGEKNLFHGPKWLSYLMASHQSLLGGGDFELQLGDARTLIWRMGSQDLVQWLGGDFRWFLFSLLLGEMVQFDSYFSDGFKPSTRWLVMQPPFISYFSGHEWKGSHDPIRRIFFKLTMLSNHRCPSVMVASILQEDTRKKRWIPSTWLAWNLGKLNEQWKEGPLVG